MGRRVERLRRGDLVWGVWGHRSAAVVVASAVAGRVLATECEPRFGVFARIGAVALNAVLDADVHVGEIVAVFGQGVAGLLATQLATTQRRTVIAVDRLPRRLALARTLGAALRSTPRPRPLPRRSRELTGGRGADVVIDLTGSGEALHEAIRSAAYAARVVVAGFVQGDGDGPLARRGVPPQPHRTRLLADRERPGSTGAALVDAAVRADQSSNCTNKDGSSSRPSCRTYCPAERVAEAFRLLDERPDDAVQVVLDFS